MFIVLEPSEYKADVACPKCKAKYHAKWDTEYGDPLFGPHSEPCPKCKAMMSFDCYVMYLQPEVHI